MPSFDGSGEQFPDLAGAILTQHLVDRVERRGLSPDLVHRALAAPDSIAELRPGRVVAQKLFEDGGRVFLLRVVVDVDRQPPEAVTAYKTSKIDKYGGSA